MAARLLRCFKNVIDVTDHAKDSLQHGIHELLEESQS